MWHFKKGIYKVIIDTVANDTTAPSVPTGLILDYDTDGLILFWNSSNDNVAVFYYEIWRSFNGGAYIAPIASSNNSPYVDLYSGLANGNYTYKVLAMDEAGNKSALSTQSNTLAIPNPA